MESLKRHFGPFATVPFDSHSVSSDGSILIRIITDKIDEKLRAHLKKYSAVYQANVTPPKFYASIGDPEKSSGPTLQSQCFEFSRFREAEKPVVSLIAQMRITKDGAALQIRPLRLYQREAIAKSDDGSYGIAASIRMNAVWLQGNRGMSEEVFNYTFLKEKITLSEPKPVLKYFFDKDKEWEDCPVLPLPPWSTNVHSAKSAGNVEITIAMAESGKPNELLKFFANLFESQSNDPAELLKDATEARLR